MFFIKAEVADGPEIMQLYKAAVGTEGCTWSEEYPSEETLWEDMSRQGLYCMKTEQGEIIGAITLDEDPVVEALPCWSKERQPGAELSRLVVKASRQNQGIARELLSGGMELLRKRGYKSAHFLVSKYNERALRSYAKLEFDQVGESDLFGEQWWCYEKEL